MQSGTRFAQMERTLKVYELTLSLTSNILADSRPPLQPQALYISTSPLCYSPPFVSTNYYVFFCSSALTMTSKYQAGEPWADTHDVSTGLSLARAHQLTICRSPFSEQSSTSS